MYGRITGWDMLFQTQLQLGERAVFTVPAALAYGKKGAGRAVPKVRYATSFNHHSILMQPVPKVSYVASSNPHSTLMQPVPKVSYVASSPRHRDFIDTDTRLEGADLVVAASS